MAFRLARHIDTAEELVGGAEVSPTRVLGDGEVHVSAGLLSERSRLDDTHLLEVEQVEDLVVVTNGDDAEVALVSPPAHERVTFDDPEKRTYAGLLETCAHDDREVQTGAYALAEHLSRCADLLTGIVTVSSPARRRVGVGDIQLLHRLIHSLSDLIDAVGAGLVALDGRAARPSQQDPACASKQLGHLGTVGHDVGGQHLQAETKRLCGPVRRRVDLDVGLLDRDAPAVRVEDLDAQPPRPMRLDLGHRRWVELELEVSKRKRRTGREVNQLFERLAETTLCVAHFRNEAGCPQLVAAVLKPDLVDHIDPVVGHRIGHDGNCVDLDGDRASAHWCPSPVSGGDPSARRRQGTRGL